MKFFFIIVSIVLFSSCEEPTNSLDVKPEASFKIDKITGSYLTVLNLDASESDIGGIRNEIRWDFESDGVWDTEYLTSKKIRHQFNSPGDKLITLEVKNPHNGQVDEASVKISLFNSEPTAKFTIRRVDATNLYTFQFDATESNDVEDAKSELQVRWDFENDGVWDRDYSKTKTVDYQFPLPMSNEVKLEVKDIDGTTSTSVVSMSSFGPSANFTINQKSGTIHTLFNMEAVDDQKFTDHSIDLYYRWDFDNDGVWDTEFTPNKTINHQFPKTGENPVRLQVRDMNGFIGKTRVISIHVYTPLKSVAMGSYHSAVLNEDGELWVTGSNTAGELGDGTNESKTRFVHILNNVKKVFARSNATYVIKLDNSLWVTGKNIYGQLGDGTNSNKNKFVKVMDNVSSFSAGHSSVFAIKLDGSLWATGKNDYGQLGDGTYTNKNTFVQVLDDVESVHTAFSTSYAIKKDYTLWATGKNDDAQFGDGTKGGYRNTFIKVFDNVRSSIIGAFHSFVVKTNGSLWATGSNYQGTFGNGTRGTESKSFVQVSSEVKQAYAGFSNSFIIKTDGSFWVSGRNSYGQFGNGTKADISTFTNVLDNVLSFSTNTRGTMVIKEGGSLWVTGDNAGGVFGDGTENDKLVFISLARFE